MGAKPIEKELDEYRFLSIQEVARRLDFHERSVVKLIDAGDLASAKFGRRRVIPVKSFIKYCKARMK